jgi:hypothetical protein
MVAFLGISKPFIDYEGLKVKTTIKEYQNTQAQLIV